MTRFSLLLEEDVPEDQRTGVWRYAHEVASRLVRADRATVVPVSLAGRRGPGWSLYYARAMLKKFLVRAPGPIHTLSPWFTPPGTVICNVWDVIWLTKPDKHVLDRVAYWEFFRAIREYPSEWVTLTEPTREQLVAGLRLPRDHVHVARPGVDTDRFRPVEDARRPHDKATLLHVGIGMPRKGIDTIIDALALLGPRRFRFVRVGPVYPQNEAYMDSCRRRARDLGLDLVELGRVSDEDLVRAYNDADLVVFPSLEEGAGMPPVEAMACETNVVVSDIGPHRAMCDNLARFAKPRDAADLARAIDEALAGPFPGSELRQHAKGFSWDATTDVYLGLYDQHG